MRKIHHAMEDREFESAEDLQAFLSGFAGRPIGEIVLENASDSERAQQLVYEAFEVFPSKKAATLAKQALALDEGCIDARLMLAQLSGSSRDTYATELEEIVSSAEARLGPRLREEAGHFWGILETRPYMRASLELAFALWRSGREVHACERLARMLELNPNDNQGVRGTLVGWRLATGDVAGARHVLDQCGDTGEAVLAWGRVLACWMADDLEAAAGALELARESNPHAERYFNGSWDFPNPEDGPDFYSPGEESEAVACAVALGVAWHRQPEARLWLRQREPAELD